jgi:DNA repair exonuclease SbcCD ATPase subunit
VGTLDDLTVWDSLGSIFEGGGRLQAALDKIDIEAQQRGREVEDMMQSYRDAIELEIGILEKQAEALPENSEMVAELTEKIRELQAQLGELPTAYEAGQEATARFKEENDKLARAKPFEGLKSALSSAFSDAMLSAIKGETEWADAFGKMMSSLFDALVDDLVNSMTEKLADTLIEGLTQAFDWAGDAAAGLATAVFMIVSSLLKAGDEEIKAQRENIEDLVDQTEQVRGLISGDTTVALKEVGDQLSDALVPTNEKLDQIVVLLQLATRYSGGGLQASARGASSII